MKNKQIIFGIVFLIVLFSSSFVIAECPPDCEVIIADQTYDNQAAVWSTIQNDPTYLTNNDYAQWAFNDNSQDTWALLNQNPSLMSDSDTLTSAFNNDPAKAMGLINTNVDLLDKPNVLSRLDQEIRPQEGDSEEKIQERIGLLNNNPQAKSKWIDKQYGISMKDPSLDIISYDGSLITTSGEKGGTYNLADIQEAGEDYFGSPTINEDGSLTYSSIRFTPTDTGDQSEESSGSGMQISVLRNEGGEMMRNEDGIPILHIQGGSVDLTSTSEGELGDALSIENGELHTENQEGQDVVFSGTFQVRRNDRDTTIISQGEPVQVTVYETVTFEGEEGETEVRRPYGFSFDGAVRVASQDTYMNFWIQDDTTIHSAGDLTYNAGNEGDELLFMYTYERQGVENIPCRSVTGCIIQTPGFTPSNQYMGRLVAKNLALGESGSISFTTNSYYNSVDVVNHHNGEFSFTSTSSSGDVLSKVVVDSENSMPKFQGRLDQTNVGRFDVSYPDPLCEGIDCNTIIHHWSSNSFQKKAVSNYFEKPHASFVSCIQGVDCEIEYAKSFGKIIPPVGQNQDQVGEGWTPRITIIVSGDTPKTAQALEDTCRSQGGCIILRSRDAPTQTQSTNLVLAGHHYPDDDKLWHDPAIRGDDHIPLDPLYLQDLPKGNIHAITFSACNSVHPLYSRPLAGLDRTYENLELIQGWRGTAPLDETFENGLVTSPDQISENIVVKETGNPGVRNWAYKDDAGRWVITEDGENIQQLGI